jgi:hypothetical protein
VRSVAAYLLGYQLLPYDRCAKAGWAQGMKALLLEVKAAADEARARAGGQSCCRA